MTKLENDKAKVQNEIDNLIEIKTENEQIKDIAL